MSFLGKQRRFHSFCFAAAAAFLLAGCGRMGAVSEVKPDGSLVRTLTYRGADPNAKPDASGGGGNPMSGMSGMPAMPVEALAVLPKSGAGGWTVNKTVKGTEQIVTVSRTVPPGETLSDDIGVRANPDMSFLGGPAPTAPRPAPTRTKPAPKPKARPAAKPAKGGGRPGDVQLAFAALPQTTPAAASATPKLLLSNTVTVREIEPGKLEYREVIRWNGPRPKELAEPDPEMTGKLRQALPMRLADDPAARKVTLAFQREMWRMVFGPGDPILPAFLFHQELAEYRLRSRMGAALDGALYAHFGDRITEAERRAVIAKLTDDSAAFLQNKSKKPSSGSGGSDSPGSLIAMLFRVKLPGKVLSTNGQLNPDTGEVVWPMYAIAPALEDVTLVAVCEKAVPGPLTAPPPSPPAKPTTAANRR